ncbi:hypothetical protein AG1IA_07977 [Rhizoctonia solani AG-1 IA]|uniref:Uncharacterized protein n=1 Tax=Thanatephorus cucumeris (strain AG1-IA) TaxID=983506 RepID=L8WIF5_THACA|nr:hypothetical protein AG1IA_07977 [Rhizoctonia solani AG-1 IA]
MISSRLTSVLLFVVSLGFLVCAAPSPYGQSVDAVAYRRDTGSMASLTLLEGVTRKKLDESMRVTTIEEAKSILNTTTINVRSTTESLVKKAKLNPSAPATTDLTVRTASIVSMSNLLSQKVGHEAVASSAADVDCALAGLLGKANKMAGELSQTVAPKLDVKPEALKTANFLESAKLLGFSI